MKTRMSMAFDALSGKSGSVVVADTREGFIIRPRTIPADPKTPAQTAIRANLTTAARAFAGFSPTQYAEWKAYANGLTHHNRQTGKSFKPTPINAYTALVTKMLQVNPAASLPTSPPATPFSGDSITITAESESPGIITFTASGANSSGVVTELLLQPLRNANRTPQSNGYRSKKFFAFTSGTLTTTVTVTSGYYVAGYRFVKTATGQETVMKQLPVTEVSFSVVGGTTKKAA